MSTYNIDASSFTPAQQAAVQNAAKLAAPGNTVNVNTGPAPAPTPAPTPAPASSAPANPYNAPGSTNAQGVITSTPAPAGAVKSANGNWVTPNGDQYATGPSAGGSSVPGVGGPDTGYSNAMANLTPGATPSESDFFSMVHDQISPVLDAITSAEHASEQAVYAAGTQQQTDLRASMGSRGLGGSSDAAKFAGQTAQSEAAGLATAKSNAATALSSAYQFLTGQAYTQYKDALANNQQLSSNYVATMQSLAQSTLKGIAQQGITSAAELQQVNPQEYLAVLQHFNNDPSAVDSFLALNQPAVNVTQSWVSGSTYYQLVQNPITKATKMQKVDFGTDIPPNWTTTKTTTGVIMQDPSNPANAIVVYSDPFTGKPTITGYGSMAGVTSPGSSTSGTTDTTTPPAAGNAGPGTASTTVSAILGVDPTTPLSDVISTSGMGSLVAAMIKNEGGSPSGVSNNPGNVKYTGAPGQTDSGVKATDGGTFASYATPEAGMKAISDLVTSAASGANSHYGTSPTLQSFVSTYTNTGKSSIGSNGLATGEYGLLANVAGFNPSTPGPDQSAYNYLQQYLVQGKTPSAASVGLSTRTGSGAAFNAVAQRADEVFFKATGQHLPNAATLKSNLALVSANNKLLNQLQVQSGTIEANFGLNVANITANDVNNNAPFFNSLIDSWKYLSGDPAVAQYLSQNETIANEVSSLLALKNASGTTVADKLSAAGLVPKDASVDQQAQILGTLMQEAQNANSAVQIANMKLYEQTDPLQLDSANPLNKPITISLLSDPTQTYTIQPGQMKASDLESALSSGWVMTQ